MICSLLVQAVSTSSPGAGTPAPAALFIAVVTLVLMMFRRQLHLKTLKRWPHMIQPPENDAAKPSNALPSQDVDRLDANLPLAVFLVGGDEPLGPPSLRIFGSLYAKEYPQILFVSIGVMDYQVVDSGAEGKGFKGTEEAKLLKRKTRLALDPYVSSAHDLGLKADCRVSIATNEVDEIDLVSTEVAALYPRAVFFVSKLVFKNSRWFHRLLHTATSDEIRKRLEKKGFPVTVIPVVLAQ